MLTVRFVLRGINRQMVKSILGGSLLEAMWIVMNRWLNPPREKTENEFPPQDPVTVGHGTSFSTIKKKVGKKRITKKPKKDRLIEKALDLSHRLGKS